MAQPQQVRGRPRPGRRQSRSPQHEYRYERHLVPGERTIVRLHQHWAVVAEPIGSAVVSLLVPLWVDSHATASTRIIAQVVWWLWIAVLVRALWRVLEWRHSLFVATDKRFLLTYGLITSRVAMMPLPKVTDMTYNRSVPGRVLGYGQFVLESAGQEQALHSIDYVPHPDAAYQAICTQLFASLDPDDGFGWSARSEDDEEDDGPRRGARLRELLHLPSGVGRSRGAGERGEPDEPDDTGGPDGGSGGGLGGGSGGGPRGSGGDSENGSGGSSGGSGGGPRGSGGGSGGGGRAAADPSRVRSPAPEGHEHSDDSLMGDLGFWSDPAEPDDPDDPDGQSSRAIPIPRPPAGQSGGRLLYTSRPGSEAGSGRGEADTGRSGDGPSERTRPVPIDERPRRR